MTGRRGVESRGAAHRDAHCYPRVNGAQAGQREARLHTAPVLLQAPITVISFPVGLEKQTNEGTSILPG